MIYQRLSKRQKLAMLWWQQPRFRNRDALICDGSIRSGKTVCMTVGFILWSMSTFNGQRFALCGKTIESLRRNVILNLWDWVPPDLKIVEKRSEHKLMISDGHGRQNTYFLFGGRDESSYMLIQGITLAGVLFDEVVLMPQSFVEQALARCSVKGSKFWFNCNPEGPQHWFYQDWIKNSCEKNALHINFTMDDNPSLALEIKTGNEHLYSGVFYDRYVKGLWVIADGVIYSMFNEGENTYRPDQRPAGMAWVSTRTIAIDYGTKNPMRFLDIYDGAVIWVDREYSWDSRKEYAQKTDQEYADDLLAFMGEKWCTVMVDPSAASFIEELSRRGVYVMKADNGVPDGIRKTASLIGRRAIQICKTCGHLIDEIGTYVWDEKASQRGEEKPVKQNDHSADALRYYVNSLPDWRFE